jgi:hypothetical protein
MPRDSQREPLEVMHPRLQKYIVACAACGRRGRDPAVDWDTFRPPGFGPWIADAVSDWYPILPLDGRGFCHGCASGERIGTGRARRHS